MAVLDLAHLTWEEVRDLDRTKTVAIVPVGAVEAHGPHLPLATDVIIAEAMARARSEEHTSELQSRLHLVCRLLLEKKKNTEVRNAQWRWRTHQPVRDRR